METTREIRYVNFWRRQVSDRELQLWLDNLTAYGRYHVIDKSTVWKAWISLLDEKLRRAEKEISI